MKLADSLARGVDRAGKARKVDQPSGAEKLRDGEKPWSRMVSSASRISKIDSSLRRRGFVTHARQDDQTHAGMLSLDRDSLGAKQRRASFKAVAETLRGLWP